MNPKKEDTTVRLQRRKYEETHKEIRRNINANFQTMIKRDEYNKICKFLEQKNLSKADFVRKAFEIMQKQNE